MRLYHVSTKSGQSGAGDAYGRSNPRAVKKSSEGRSIEGTSATPKQANKKTASMQEEERQDVNIGNEEAQQKFLDDLEYRMLYKEIERIDQKFQSGFRESVETISLTSTYNDEEKISPTMHTKLMRLIRAMIPNSTTEQKDSFIRDLFDMGIRVCGNNSTHLKLQPNSHLAKQAQPSADELMIDKTNSILENDDEKNDSAKINKDSIQHKPNQAVSTYAPYAQSLDDFFDGANSIVASMDEYDTPGVEMAANVNHSLSSRQYIASNPTDSSDAVDVRWEKLRDKMLNSSVSGRTGCSLSSEMEADLIQECVETGLASYQTARSTLNDYQQFVPEQREIVAPEQNRPQTVMSDGGSFLHQIMNDMHQMKIGQHPGQADVTNVNMRNRPGQPDDSSIYQPIQYQSIQERNTLSDSFSIDGATNSIVHDDSIEAKNVPSFDEGPMYENDKSSLDGSNFVNSQHDSQHEISSEGSEGLISGNGKSSLEGTTFINSHRESGSEGPMYGNDKSSLQGTNFVNSQRESQREISSEGSDESNQTHEITLHPSLKDELRIKVSGSSDMDNSNSNSNSKISADDSISDSTIVMQNESVDDSICNESKLIYVKSSLTVGTEMATLNKEPDRSFYQTVNLSSSEILEESTESPKSTIEVTPSWRWSPAESLSDFLLTVLSAEIGAVTNYYVHKHMMAIGPRSSQYMNDVFASENTSKFQVTLDEKTSTLIPEILDFIYCHDHDISMTTDNVVALRQLAKMLKISSLEVKTANFILEDMGINNLATYVSDCCYFSDIEVTKAVVEKCTTNIGSIPVSDRLWVVMEPELFLEIVSSPHIDRDALSKHLSILLMEYLDLHQYEIDADLFVTLTSEGIIPIVDRTTALPLIELSNCYGSKECEELQKRCAFTVACYWQTTPPGEKHRLFALLRNLPSSLTVDFLEIVESGHANLEFLRSEIEQQSTNVYLYAGHEQEALTVQDFCGDSMGEDHKNETLSWRMDPEKSYSDMDIRVKYLNHEGSQVYHVHKHIVAVGPKSSKFLAQHLNSSEITAGEKICIVIELDYEGSSVVPQVLDSMYPRDIELEISSENSVALHYVSRAFGISTLSKNIMKFIDQDIALENIVDYIIDGGYYRDHMTIATAGRLCAQKIMSIDIESQLLTELEPDFFEKVVSCDAIEQRAKSHVNVLIAKYLLVRILRADVIEKLFNSIHVDQIDKHSALNLLKIGIKLKEYEGIETFEMIKKKCIDVITKNWTELTADNHRREDLFSILPSFTSDLVTSMFDTVDSKTRKGHRDAMSQQADFVKLCQGQVAEVNRLRQQEVSCLKKELEVRTSKMLILQKELEGKLDQVDRALTSRTKTNQYSEISRQGIEVAWYQQGGGNNVETVVEGSEPTDNSNEGKEQEEMNSDQQSVSTVQVQKKKGRMCC